MNIEGARKFINDHKDRIIDLFLIYQTIEMVLFLKLHLPDIPEVEYEEGVLDGVNKELNSKTLGKLKNKYLEKFPNDDYNLKFDLEIIAMQRNSFMHSLWMVIALAQDQEKITKIGEMILNDSYQGANELLKKVYKLPARK